MYPRIVSYPMQSPLHVASALVSVFSIAVVLVVAVVADMLDIVPAKHGAVGSTALRRHSSGQVTDLQHAASTHPGAVVPSLPHGTPHHDTNTRRLIHPTSSGGSTRNVEPTPPPQPHFASITLVDDFVINSDGDVVEASDGGIVAATENNDKHLWRYDLASSDSKSHVSILEAVKSLIVKPDWLEKRAGENTQ